MASPAATVSIDGADCRVLHVDDDSSFVSMSKTFLESAAEGLAVATETDPVVALDRLETERFECVVSDFDMPNLNGLEFLRTVNDRTDLPFILFTGKGSEEIASDAISAGVTDYIQKETGTEQYAVLANRIVQVVEKRRADIELERRLTAIEAAHDGIGILNDAGEYEYMNPAYAEAYGYRTEDLIGEHWRALYPDEEIDRFNDRILPRLEAVGHWHGTSVGRSRDGDPVPEELSLAMLEDGGHVCVLKERDVARFDADHATAVSFLRECIEKNGDDMEDGVLEAAREAMDTLDRLIDAPED